MLRSSAIVLLFLLAGCAGAKAPDAPLDDAQAVAPSEEADGLVEAIEFEGRAGAGRDEIVSQHIGRELVGGDVTVTWTAANGETEKLRAEVWMFASCPDGCHRHEELDFVEGASPLVIRLGGHTFEEGETIGLYVRPVPSDGLDLGLGPAVEQDFQATGTFDFQA